MVKKQGLLALLGAGLIAGGCLSTDLSNLNYNRDSPVYTFTRATNGSGFPRERKNVFSRGEQVMFYITPTGQRAGEKIMLQIYDSKDMLLYPERKHPIRNTNKIKKSGLGFTHSTRSLDRGTYYYQFYIGDDKIGNEKSFAIR